MNLFGFDFGPDRIVLGLFTGLTYGLLAVGLVLVYRSSRFINFAHGAVGAFGAAILGRLVTAAGIPYWIAFPLALAVAAGLSAVIELVVVRRVRSRPRIIGMIATLGLSQFVLIVALLINPQGVTGATFPRPPGLPSFTVGRTVVGPAFTAMLLLAPILLGALAYFLRRSRHGLAIRAAADAPEAAALDGVPAARMATVAWGIAGAVAAFSAILVTPTQGAQSIESLGPDLLLRGLAGAVLARFSSIPRALVASLGIGVAEQILRSGPSGSGLVELALAAIILVALLRQPLLSRRDEGGGGWTTGIGGRAIGWLGRGFAIAAGVGAVGLAYLVTNEQASVLTQVVGYALVGLSVLLVTGIAGELSLGQFAFAGVGGAVSVRVAAGTGNLFLGVLAGCAVAAAAAVLVGWPALRLRGMALAVTTLAFALATSAWLLRRDLLLGNGVDVPKPSWAGYPLDLAKDYYLFALLLLGLGLWIVHNVRRGGVGRVWTALRDNEDAARALTVPARLRKLQAYAVAGALAGLGGAVIGHGQTQLTVNSFPASASIDVVAVAVVGGLGVLGGPIIGALLLVGLPGLLPLGIPGQAALTLGWLLVVILLPTGLGGLLARWFPAGRSAPAAAAASLPARDPRSPTGLVVRDVARSFGGVTAVAGVSLDVRPGEIVGVIGPNGAGKTTLFEILAGFCPADRGRITFAGQDITLVTPERRASLGLVRSFQDARLFGTLTVRETLMIALEADRPSRLLVSALGAPEAERAKRRRAAELLDLAGLEAIADQPVGSLSTGTRRSVELACLLALRPTLLLLDEPSSGVSQADGVALAETLRRVHREHGTTMLIIEHDLPLLAGLADRLIALDRGRVIADGTPDEVRQHPAVMRSYLGTDEAAVQRSSFPPAPILEDSYGH